MSIPFCKCGVSSHRCELEDSDEERIHWHSARRSDNNSSRRNCPCSNTKKINLVSGLRDNGSDEDAPIYPLDPKEPENPGPKKHPPKCDSTPSWEFYMNLMFYILAGYIVGILLVNIWYFKHRKKACRDLNETWIFIVITWLALILMLSKRQGRCILALCLATLSSYHFRVLVIAFAFLIAWSGPVNNIVRSLGIMCQVLGCNKGRLRVALEKLHCIMVAPSSLVEETIWGFLNSLNKVLNRLDKHLLRLELPVSQIQATYRGCTDWLALKQHYFNLKMDSPSSRCLKAGWLVMKLHNEQVTNPPEQDPLSGFCENLRGLDSFFENSLPLQQGLIEDIFRRLRVSFVKLRFTFLASVSIEQDTQWPDSTSAKDLMLIQDVHEHMELHRNILFFIHLLLYAIIFVLVFKLFMRAIYFYFHYRTNLHFENVYITSAFYEWDETHSRCTSSRVLPLNCCEKNKYINITSMRLLAEEFETMKHSGLFLTFMGIQLFCLCSLDYGLVSMTRLVTHYVNSTDPSEEDSIYESYAIEGGGSIGILLSILLKAFKPSTFLEDRDSCLLVPLNPKKFHYLIILLLYVLAWFLVFWEPYGLRTRHKIMAYFYPKDAHDRALQLHSTILENRDYLLKERRHRARLINTYSDKSKSFILHYATWLCSVNLWCLSGCPGDFMPKPCTICSKTLSKSNCIACPLPHCKGIYCEECFLESNNYCILCSFSSTDSDTSNASDSGDNEGSDCDRSDVPAYYYRSRKSKTQI